MTSDLSYLDDLKINLHEWAFIDLFIILPFPIYSNARTGANGIYLVTIYPIIILIRAEQYPPRNALICNVSSAIYQY